MSGRRPPGDSSASGATILGSHISAGGSTAYKVMDGYPDQVILLVMMEEFYFSMPVGTPGGAASSREFESSPFGRRPMQATPSGPSNRPKDSLELQLALLLLRRQRSSPAGPSLANTLPPGPPRYRLWGPGLVTVSARFLMAQRV